MFVSILLLADGGEQLSSRCVLRLLHGVAMSDLPVLIAGVCFSPPDWTSAAQWGNTSVCVDVEFGSVLKSFSHGQFCPAGFPGQLLQTRNLQFRSVLLQLPSMHLCRHITPPAGTLGLMWCAAEIGEWRCYRWQMAAHHRVRFCSRVLPVKKQFLLLPSAHAENVGFL